MFRPLLISLRSLAPFFRQFQALAKFLDIATECIDQCRSKRPRTGLGSSQRFYPDRLNNERRKRTYLVACSRKLAETKQHIQAIASQYMLLQNDSIDN